MARYEVRVRKSVAKDLAPIPKKDVQKIMKAIEGLADNPRPHQSRRLSGADKHRLRCGIYRVLYEIEDDILVICVVKVGPRKDVYRD
jgi:mRNA interferase RelE/StbE